MKKNASGFSWADLDELARDKPWLEQVEIRQCLMVQDAIQELLEQEISSSESPEPVELEDFDENENSPQFAKPRRSSAVKEIPSVKEIPESKKPKKKKPKKKTVKPVQVTNKKKKYVDADDEFLDQAIKEAEILRKNMKQAEPTKKEEPPKKIIQVPVNQMAETIFVHGNKEQIFTLIDQAVSTSEKFSALLARTKEAEKKMAMKLNDAVWLSMCQSIYLKYREQVIIEHARHSCEYYQAILMNYMRDIACTVISNMREKTVFDKYDPDSNPICLIFLQKHPNEVFPTLDTALTVNSMVKEKLFPDNHKTYRPFGEGKKLWGYAMMYSLSMRFSLLMALFEDEPGKYIYYMIAYNRVHQDINELLKRDDIKFMKDSSEESFVDGQERLVITRNECDIPQQE